MLTRHLKLALKVLLRRKFFTFVSLFGTSVTLLVLVLASAMLDDALAPTAPEIHLDRTLFVTYMAMRGEGNEWSGSPGYGFLDRYVRDIPHVERMAVFSGLDQAATFVRGQKVVSSLRRTDAEYWRILDYRFVEGHPFTEADVANGSPVAVLTEATARRLFPDAAAMGKRFETQGKQYTVIGVVKNVSRVRDCAFADLWAPITTLPTDLWRNRLMGDFNALLLADSPRNFRAIKAEFAARLPHVEMTEPDRYKTMSGSPRTRLEVMAGELAGLDSHDVPRTAAFVGGLVVLALLFMMLPAINLVNLTVSRIFERAPEIGVRKAFGASTLHLVGQFVTENVVLSVIGGVIGLALAFAALAAINDSGLIPNADFRMNPRILLYGVGLSLVFGVLSGAYPAWRMARLDPIESLRGGPR